VRRADKIDKFRSAREARGASPHSLKLTYSHIAGMVFHMKTTLNIDDTVMNRLRREAARQGKTMSELVEAALRLLFHTRRKSKRKLKPLPTFRSGGHLVDIADRDALYDVMEGRR
jgi:ribbon-helix-helix CopG family protein